MSIYTTECNSAERESQLQELVRWIIQKELPCNVVGKCDEEKVMVVRSWQRTQCCW
jgi:hypothetical protein